MICCFAKLLRKNVVLHSLRCDNITPWSFATGPYSDVKIGQARGNRLLVSDIESGGEGRLGRQV